MKKLLINTAVCSGIVLLGGAVTFGITTMRGEPDSEPQPIARVTNVRTMPIELTTVHDTFTVTGRLEPWKEVLLSSESKGKVEWMGVESGDKVNAGEELLRIDRLSAEIQYKQAMIEFAMASLELERVRTLRDKGIGSAQAFDKAKVDRDVAQSHLNAREVELTYTAVVAPFSGFVDKLLQEKDEFVNVGTPLVELIQIHQLKMVVGIADQDIPNFSNGDAVTVIVDAYRENTFSGIIYRIGHRADAATHTFETEIVLDNEFGILKPGMIARAELTRASYPDSVVIPIFSILTDQAQAYVFVEEGGVAVRTPVHVELNQGNHVVIREGLNSGDRLVVAGHRNLHDGDRINAQGVTP